MKMNGYVWRILLLILVAMGCSDQDTSLDKFVSDRVELTDLEVILPSAGKTESTIITSDLPWSIEGTSSWCRVSPLHGTPGTSTIYFVSDPNPDYDDRSVNFTLVAGTRPIVLTVYQKKKDEIIFDKDKFDNISMDGEEIAVAMSANVSYTVTIAGDAVNWITHLPASRVETRGLERKTERFKIDPTDEWSERSGRIIFIREDELTRDTVTVFQVQRDKILLSPAECRPPLEGQTIKVELRSNVEYEITVPEEYREWISYQNDLRPDVVLVKVEESAVERYGEIIFQDRNNPAVKAVLKIYQVEKETILFEEQQIEVEREGGVYQLDVLDNISGNYELVIPQYATWITKAPESRALSASKVSIVVAGNPEGQIPRKAKLFLRGILNDTLVSAPIEVLQKGRAVMTVDTLTLIKIQELMGMYHANWPGGTMKNPSYTGATFSPNKVTGVCTGLALGAPGGLYRVAYENTELPDIVGDLQNLTTLALGGHLSGNIPKTIGSLSKLATLTISAGTGNNYFNELPVELGALESLTSLTIRHDFSKSGQDLAEVLAIIGELTNLKTLIVSGCNYGTTMSESWRGLKKLESLTLEGTGFTNLGPLSDMTSLKTLSITADSISDLPDLSRLTNLTSITLSNNARLKQIPASVMKCGSLTSLTIASNKLERLPEDWSGLTNLTSLNLSNGTIGGTLPASMGSLEKLTTLNVGTNNLEGEIPAELGNLKNLSTFTIRYNKFSSMAVGVVGNWTKITTLYLYDNAFVELPLDIGKMTWLKNLYAENNEFKGEIPASIGDLADLEILRLFRDTTKYAKGQGLTGFIPASITKLKKLKQLWLYNNNLYGPIPANIGDMTALRQIYLNDNSLSGDIPLSLTKIQPGTDFMYIHLHNNNLSGYIPPDFKALPRIYQLDLRNNNLIGTVPAGIVGGTNSYNSNTAYLHLSGNRLTGVIPVALRDLLKVYEAGTANDRMSGTRKWHIFEQQDGFGLTFE